MFLSKQVLNKEKKVCYIKINITYKLKIIISRNRHPKNDKHS